MEAHECVTSKPCSKCKVVKPLDAFSFSKGKPSSQCKACNNAYHREHYLKNREKVLERTQRYKEENKEKVKQFLADWYQRNREHVLNRCAEYRKNPDVLKREKERSAAYYDARKKEIQAKRKEALLADMERQHKLTEYQRQHYRENKHLYNARVVKRRRAKDNQTPIWADLQKIKEVYELAQMMQETTGEQYHVDHIIPLQGKNVCGLHVAENLQVVPAKVNLQKAAKFG